MGWGEPIRPNTDALAATLADAVRAFLNEPTTGRMETMTRAVNAYDLATTRLDGRRV